MVYGPVSAGAVLVLAGEVQLCACRGQISCLVPIVGLTKKRDCLFPVVPLLRIAVIFQGISGFFLCLFKGLLHGCLPAAIAEGKVPIDIPVHKCYATNRTIVGKARRQLEPEQSAPTIGSFFIWVNIQNLRVINQLLCIIFAVCACNNRKILNFSLLVLRRQFQGSQNRFPFGVYRFTKQRNPVCYRLRLHCKNRMLQNIWHAFDHIRRHSRVFIHDLCDFRFSPIDFVIRHTDAFQRIRCCSYQKAVAASSTGLAIHPFIKLLGKLFIQSISRFTARRSGVFAVQTFRLLAGRFKCRL